MLGYVMLHHHGSLPSQQPLGPGIDLCMCPDVCDAANHVLGLLLGGAKVVKAAYGFRKGRRTAQHTRNKALCSLLLGGGPTALLFKRSGKLYLNMSH